MAESMLREEVEVYSEKHDIHGVVRDYGMAACRNLPGQLPDFHRRS